MTKNVMNQIMENSTMAAVIVWGPWGVRDLDWFGRMRPPEVR